ncbi:ABC transporter substrate-binding protein [Corynebacterium parakroppenstedtii]|uniref:ABC transporter substrate-binding protein n=1 Tax=Corynebacterium parakroppenstedtii TaxID=2828363 RepID=UPI0030EF6E71
MLQRFKKSRPQFPSAMPSLPRSPRARVRKIMTAISGALLVTGLAACDTNDDADDDHTNAGFAYVSGSTLTTVNGASSQGQASDAARLSVRLYPGAFIDGPNGQSFVNNDLFTSIQAPDENRSAEYVINPRAQYSDGKPVTCDDFYLAWFAQHKKEYFDSDNPLLEQVESVTCRHNEKKFRVNFARGYGSRYQNLFPAGSVMPSHIIASHAGVDDLTGALESADYQVVKKVGDLWKKSFLLKEDNLENIVSTGPYSVKSITDKDSTTHTRSVTLQKNPHWWGDPAEIDDIVVYPRSASLSDLAHHKTLRVVDNDQALPSEFRLSQGKGSAEPSEPSPSTTSPASETSSAAALVSSAVPTSSAAPSSSVSNAPSESLPSSEENKPATNDNEGFPAFSVPHDGGSSASASRLTVDSEKYGLMTMLSRRIDSLIPADHGVMASKRMRQAVSQCVDRAAVAEASSAHSSMKVPAYGLRLTPATSSSFDAVSDVALKHGNHDAAAARKAAKGSTVRLSYDRTNDRYAAMANAIRESCQESGITVDDVSTDHADSTALTDRADIFLQAVDPTTYFSTSTFVGGTIDERQQAEEELWDSMPTIPLSAEPRTVVVHNAVSNLVPSTSNVGVGWNMDRWKKDQN